MPMQNLEKAVRSLPMAVRFAGFESTTLKLAQAGWDLSMIQRMDMRHGDPLLQLAMRLECSGASYYAVSAPLSLTYEQMMRAERGMRMFAGPCDNIPLLSPEEIFSRVGFDIVNISAGPGSIRFMSARQPRGSVSFTGSFDPIDAMPSTVEERVDEIRFFKVASKPSVKDLIVAPGDVPELLDAVIRAQKPLMDKIKARERSRENMEHMRNGFRPRTEVAMQVLALAE